MKDVVQLKNIKYFMISAHFAILRTKTDSRESTDNEAAFKKNKKKKSFLTFHMDQRIEKGIITHSKRLNHENTPISKLQLKPVNDLERHQAKPHLLKK